MRCEIMLSLKADLSRDVVHHSRRTIESLPNEILTQIIEHVS